MPNKIETVLPEQFPGGVNYRRETGGADQYGTLYTITSIITICYEWSKRYPDRPISWGDISRKGGGHFPGHGSHRLGVDADARPMNNLEPWRNVPTTIHASHYSQRLTRELLELARSIAKFDTVLFNDKYLAARGLCRPYPNHNDHLHFRFRDKSMEPKPLLVRGDHGAEVMLLQDQLLRLGLLKASDLTLHYDDATEAAIRKFQSNHEGLKVDGRKGPLTQAAIDRDLKGVVK